MDVYSLLIPILNLLLHNLFFEQKNKYIYYNIQYISYYHPDISIQYIQRTQKVVFT